MTEHKALLERIVAPFARTNQSPSGITALATVGEDPAFYTWGDEYSPTTPYRVASITKSFTCLALLILRREGALSLEEPLSTYLPEITYDMPSDWPEITVRHTLSMSAGFATDNPWGDRQESISTDELVHMMQSGIRPIFPAGTGLEYSNFGYALLGEIITRVSGQEFREFVMEHVIRPVGLEQTRFTVEEVAPAVQGWHRESALPGEPGGWTPEEPSGPGGFSSIGGLFSTASDLIKWATMFLTLTPPAGARFTADDLRTMQHIVKTGTSQHWAKVNAWTTEGYAFGLRVHEVAGVGRVIGHAGGYPGFTCQMLWHENSQAIVITSGNGTHAGAPGLAHTIMQEYLSSYSAESLVDAWPELEHRAQQITEFVRSAIADKPVSHDAFAMNVELDMPLARRVDYLRSAAMNLGALRDALPIKAHAPCRGTWDIPAEHGTLRIFIELEPLAPFAVQTFTVEMLNGWKKVRLF